MSHWAAALESALKAHVVWLLKHGAEGLTSRPQLCATPYLLISSLMYSC